MLSFPSVHQLPIALPKLLSILWLDWNRQFLSSTNQLIPFGNSHYLARLRQNSDYVCIGFEVFGVILCLIAMYFCYFHFDEFHFTVAHAYAKLGNQHAQHIVGERLLHGKGVDMNKVSQEEESEIPNNNLQQRLNINLIAKLWCLHLV